MRHGCWRLLQRQDPLGQFFCFSSRHLWVGWHWDLTPHTAAALHDLGGQLAFSRFVAFVLGSDFFVAGTDQLGIDCVAGEAVLSLASCSLADAAPETIALKAIAATRIRFMSLSINFDDRGILHLFDNSACKEDYHRPQNTAGDDYIRSQSSIRDRTPAGS